jgi:hypothetical protein
VADVTFRVEAWAGDLTIGKQTFEVGTHEVKADAKLARALAGAEGAGGITLIDGDLPDDHVESDEDSLKALEQAQADGRWQQGNLEDFIAVKGNSIREMEALLDRDSLVGVVPSQALAAFLPEGADPEEQDEPEIEDASREYMQASIAATEQQIEQAQAALKEMEG